MQLKIRWGARKRRPHRPAPASQEGSGGAGLGTQRGSARQELDGFMRVYLLFLLFKGGGVHKAWP